MIKMVVSSFYNTLLDEEEAIPTSTMLEIERIRKKGIPFCICTNRLYTEVLEYNKDFPFVDYIISLNGAFIYDVLKNQVLLKSKLSLPNIKRIQSIYDKYEMNYYTESDVYHSLDEVGDKDIYKIEVLIDDDKEKDKISKYNLNASILEWDNKKYLEITSNRSSMFQGVDRVSIKLNINLNDLVVIGANESDVSLIGAIPRNFVMKNSCRELLKMDVKKTSSNTSKGVERVLKRIKT